MRNLSKIRLFLVCVIIMTEKYNLLPSVTNDPIERDESRAGLVIDHYQKMKPGSPTKSKRRRGPVIPAVGSLIGVAKVSVPSYSEITEETTIHDPDNYDILYTVEITPFMDVRINGILIASAPEYRHLSTGRTKKITQAERARFCRGVVWWLLNDQTCLKDKLAELSIVPVPAPVPVVVPADAGIEGITGSPYPGPALIPDPADDVDPIVSADIEEMKMDEPEDAYPMPDEPIEVVREFCTIPRIRQFPAGWINHLRITITEEAYRRKCTGSVYRMFAPAGKSS